MEKREEEREQLEKIDMLRSRFSMSYAEARRKLEASGWNLIAALEEVEAERSDPDRKEQRRRVIEELKVTGGELVDTIKRLLYEGNINRIIVKDAMERELLNLPVNGLVAVTLLLPVVTAIGAVAVVAMDYRVLVERQP